MTCELLSRLCVCAGHWCNHWRRCWHYGCQANLTSFRHIHGQTITGQLDLCIHPGTDTTWFHRCSCKHYPCHLAVSVPCNTKATLRVPHRIPQDLAPLASHVLMLDGVLVPEASTFVDGLHMCVPNVGCGAAGVKRTITITIVA